MLNFKKLTICFIFISLILSLFLPLTNVLAEDIPTVDLTLPFITTPVIGPLIAAFKAAELMGFSPTQGFTTDPAPYIANGIMLSVGNLLSSLSTLIITLGQGVLGAVLNSGYTWLSPTDFDPASKTYNEVVATGWGIVRNVANAALVIGLIIIAINIILGREENKAKKTLINFIIIALLINFTPIICGFIIDGSNILMKSFASGGIDSTMSNNIFDGFTSVFSNDSKKGIENLLSMALYLMFALVIFFIYLLYSLLFIGRAIILWLLVIVSPIAFATKVFPQSKYIKKVFPSILYWDDWWESFMQWCVIGIPAGMSIYLANMTIKNITFNIDTTDSISMIASIAASSVEYLIPFIILIAGFFISISAGGQIGSKVGGIASGAWAMTGRKVTDRLTGGVKERAERSLTVAKEGIAGTGGALLSGKTPLSFENREEGRRTLDKLSFGAPSAKDDKEAAQDYLKKHPGAYDFKTREGLKRTELNKDVGEYIDSAKTPDELKATIRDIETLGSQKTKDMAAIKLAGKTDILKDGYSNFVNNTANKINITNKIEGMSAKTAQKDISAKALGNYDIFKNLNVKQIDYIADSGSEKQRQAMKEMIWGSGNADFTKKMSDLVLKYQNKVPGKTFTSKEIDEAKAEYDKNVENIQALINKKIV
ncbi:MAG: hypothetical protein WA092_00780 [Minisyncoccales bacterium]|jgi:hypothetical protein